MVCRGDERCLCDGCKARFGCYTGEMPEMFMYDAVGNRIMLLKKIEENLIGYCLSQHILANAYYDKNGELLPEKRLDWK